VPSATASSTASEPPSSSTGVGCRPDQLSASITAWEGAAGSRIATIEARNSGTDSCTLGGPPAASLLDRGGQVLVASSEPAGGASDHDLAAGQSARLFVGVANWCNDPPQEPVSIGLTMPDGQQLVVPSAAGVSFEPPPCNGPNQPATISVQPESWTPVG
jgi:hypothetical protein